MNKNPLEHKDRSGVLKDAVKNRVGPSDFRSSIDDVFRKNGPLFHKSRAELEELVRAYERSGSVEEQVLIRVYSQTQVDADALDRYDLAVEILCVMEDLGW